MTAVPIPSDLNEDLIRRALNPLYGDDYEITALDFELISGKGDNYCSNIYRAAISLREKGTNTDRKARLIIKDLHKDIIEFGMKEFEMYDKVLIQMHEIMNAHRSEEEKVKFAPDCLLASKANGELYVFEDMNAMGYELGSRWDGLNEEQVRLALKKLAQFHATSMIFAEKNPAVIQAIGKSHLKDGVPEIIKSMAHGSIEAGADFIEQIEGHQELAAKVRKSLSNFDRKMQALASDEGCAVKVINHGDLWLSNILFRPTLNNKKAYDDAVMLDFQLCFYGSPGIDLNLFLHTSVQPSIIKLERYQLLRVYYKHFKDTLIELALKPDQIPSFEMILAEVKRCEYYTFYAVMSELPLICLSAELSKNITLTTFSDAKAIKHVRESMFKDKRVSQTLVHTLDRLNELGILD